MKSFSIFLILGFLLLSSVSHAGYEWGFANMSFNRLFWSDDTKKKSTKTDFNYLELEGGGQFNWGELYGFFDIENPERGGNQVRTASKGAIRYYLGKSHFSIYAHAYSFNSFGFSDQNRVLGFGYELTGPGWWVKPFLGIHQTTQTFFSGMNGFMGGWVIGYGFKLFQQDFLATNWHETEFARHPTYAASNGGQKVSQNGALGLWWNVCPQSTIGIQWRYAVDKLGTAGYSGAAIASVRYNF